MKKTSIPFEKTGYFSKTMIDYLNQEETIKPFYGNFSKIEAFDKQIEIKRKSVKNTTRIDLVNVLKEQYKNIKVTNKTTKHIDLLLKENTFTITTGHQLNLFTGPLYFLYKIINTINLCEELSKKYPNEHFVPVYWMATEDHDFEEINYFNFKQKKIKWSSKQTGAVGKFSTDGLEMVFDLFSRQLNSSKNANELRELFRKGYLENDNLSDATRFIANELFGKYGLVIIDADNKCLKKQLIPFVEKELLEQTSFKQVSKTIIDLQKNYNIQVNPREINLFYIEEGVRERILFQDGIYIINNSELSFTKEEIIKELYEFPEKFSPNVIMRPLYQEIILPNLCYIGGGGELAYWLQLKKYFEKVEVSFPILLLRNSILVIPQKESEKRKKLSISYEDLFLDKDTLLSKKIIENTKQKVDFSKQKQFLQEQFNSLRILASQTDKSFIGAVNAQEKKQLNGLDNLEKRWVRAEKKNQQYWVDSILELKNTLFPNDSLEERQRNFSEYYLEYGADFITYLKDNIKPLELKFTLLEM